MTRIRIFSLCLIVLLISGLSAEDWQEYTTANSGIASDQVSVILLTADDLKWIGTDQGLSVYDGLNWKTLTEETGLSDQRVNDLSLLNGAAYYSIWVATDSGSTELEIHSFDDIRVVNAFYASPTDLISNWVNAIAPDNHRVKWIGTNDGVSVFDGLHWTQLTEDDYLSSNFVYDVESDTTGLVHIATKGGGVTRLRMDEVDGITSASTIVPAWTSLPLDTVNTIYIDTNNVQWYGNREGAFRHEGIDSKTNWTVFRTTNGLIDNHIQCIAEDARGGIWFGTPLGASYYDGETFTNYKSSNGLVSNNVKDIAVAAGGDIWFATDSGVSLLKSPTAIPAIESTPGSFTLTNFPNPFNQSTNIQLLIKQPGWVNVTLFNSSGQQERTIADRYVSAGVHRFRWNGANDIGIQSPSGVYFAVMNFKGKTITRKLILLK